MSQVINTNILSLTAQRNLSQTGDQLATALERLSSGLRINSASDDAAGLAISERFTTQIRGLEQAVRNANDGISFAQTAEGALSTVSDNLQRIRELAVQSANDTNSSADRQALNNEVGELLAEINRVANSTEFNGQAILDGTLDDLVFQVGANAGQTITVSGVDSRGSQLGAETFEADAFARTGTAGFGVSGFEINGEAIDLSNAETGADVIDAINAVSADSGVTASRASETAVNVGAIDTTSAGTVTINGVDVAIAASATDADVVDAVNEVSGQTGVEASLDGSDLVLTASNGASFTLQESANALLGGTTADFTTETTFDAGIVLATDIGETITTAGSNLDGIGLTPAGGGSLTLESNILNGVDVLTRDNATEALQTLDFALSQVSGLRAELGATQTRFESTIDNLSVTTENLTAARSRILDADFAKETADLTRAQILQQAGTSVLAQANAAPQNVLSLLQ
jgi:flagellin